MTTSTAVSTRPARTAVERIETENDLRDFLMLRASDFEGIAKSTGVEPERLVAELVLAARKTPAILKCDHDSIINFMYQSAQLGLVIGHGCFPVPISGKLECWVGYKGLIELVKYGRGARDVYAECVYEGDTFSESLGLYPTMEHEPGPNFGNVQKITDVYAVAVISQTIRRHKRLRREQVERYRKMSRNGNRGPWVDHYDMMAKKTAILRLISDMPRNPRLALALAAMEKSEGVVLTENDIEPAPRLPLEALHPGVEQPAIAVATPAEKAAAFEELPAPVMMAPRAEVFLPQWRGHPLAGRKLSECDEGDLNALYSALKSSDKAASYEQLLADIVEELEFRR